MQNVTIKLDDVVNHGAEHNEDFGAITVCVGVIIDGKAFGLNFQSVTGYSYQATSEMGLNESSGDQQDGLAELFDYVDADGDSMSGSYSDEYERIVAIAKSIAQEAADSFFAELPEKTEE